MKSILAYDIALTTGGTETVALAESAASPYPIGAVRVSGTQTLSSNFLVSPTGTAYKNMQVHVLWEAACTPSGNTVTIFGQAVPEELLSSDFIAVCTYNGSAWKVNLLPDWAATSIVNTSRLEDASVTTAKVVDANITTAKIADSNVTTAKIADSNVTTAKIADANVTAAKLATDSVETAKIKDANVTAAKLASDSVETAKIVDAAVTNAKLATPSRIYSKYSDTGTSAGTTEETLATYTLSAGYVANNGESIRITAAGSFGANAHTKTVKIKVGSNTYVTNAATTAPNGVSWVATVLIKRTGATGAVAIGSLLIDTEYAENVNINKSGITWGSANTITVTGQNGSASANDIVCSIVDIEHLA
jgi:hypothetical protein